MEISTAIDVISVIRRSVIMILDKLYAFTLIKPASGEIGAD
jgi:hypothetical protein